jgi:hypothetical protein
VTNGKVQTPSKNRRSESRQTEETVRVMKNVQMRGARNSEE